MSAPVIILGDGGHAKVLLDVLLINKFKILGFTSPRRESAKSLPGIPFLGDDEAILQFAPDQIQLINGIGSVGLPVLRRNLFNQLKAKGYSFLSVAHPSAIIAANCILSEGVQCMAGAIIQPGSHIGCNCIVNTRASVDHDCLIGNHVHIAPGVTLSGGVKVGAGVHIGTGATVIQYVSIGEGSLIGAGALVTRDVPAGVKAIGSPARIFNLVKEDENGSI
jgi:UDP-perosamine 4-acetyltransferase